VEIKLLRHQSITIKSHKVNFLNFHFKIRIFYKLFITCIGCMRLLRCATIFETLETLITEAHLVFG